MTHPNPCTRSDTMLGVCQAVAEEFGFSPVILRVAFGVMLFWNIEAAVIAYLAIGLIVLTVRLLMPLRTSDAAERAAAPAADNDADPATLPLAA